MMKTIKRLVFFYGLILSMIAPMQLEASPPSRARQWMEVLLEAIEQDGRGPTIHARNLFHVSAAMYDAWALFDAHAQPWLLGQTRDGFHCPCELDTDTLKGDRDSLREVAISYAVYRILETRFDNFSGKVRTLDVIQEGFAATGLNKRITSKNYQSGSAAELGNYIGDCYLRYGFEDGSHEVDDYENLRYEPQNPPLQPSRPGTPSIQNPNLWQPLYMREYIHQRGGDPGLAPSNLVIAEGIQLALSPEWGDVIPFCLREDQQRTGERNSGEYKIYLDPGPPPLLSEKAGFPEAGSYKWGFLLVALWSGHHDPKDSVYWDISPGAIGRVPEVPTHYAEYGNFYDLLNGGLMHPKGHPVNPSTQKPYSPNRVLRGDYTRVLAEYWADALNTATPPGHWFRILGELNDHPEFERKWEGKGKVLDPLEWDVKSYFILGGAMHDAAIAAWSVKGYYDYVRPISAIRYMAGKGQCTDSSLANYHPLGLPLIPGRVESVEKGDPLAGAQEEHLGKIKLYAWRGPDHITDFEQENAGVGWILGENWWPYQRYSVPTPNFAGYVSGHSAFSAAAAEVLTRITGDPYFPGGLAEYTLKKDDFLEFEKGPAKDITLQWATYQDAAAETCLSRIWGGIHPPADDLPGRIMGKEIGKQAFLFGAKFWD